MYTEYFGLTQEPFRSRFEGLGIYVGPQQAAAISRIKKALAIADAVATVCGPVGIGKSTIVSRAIEVAAPQRRVARIGRMRLGPDEILELLLEKFGVSRQPVGTIQRFAAFKRLLDDCAANDTRAIIIVEDARRIGIDAVLELEALTAADGVEASSANVVLMGDDKLPEFLADPALARLQQRTRTRQAIRPFSLNELHDYLKHCVHLAGGEFDAMFEQGSMETLLQCSGGIPRIVNNICETALTEAADEGASRVSVELLQHVAREVYDIDVGTPPLPSIAVPLGALEPAWETAAGEDLEQDDEFHCSGEFATHTQVDTLRADNAGVATRMARDTDTEFEEVPVGTFDSLPQLSITVSKSADVLEKMLDEAMAGLGPDDTGMPDDDAALAATTPPADEEIPVLQAEPPGGTPAAADDIACAGEPADAEGIVQAPDEDVPLLQPAPELPPSAAGDARQDTPAPADDVACAGEPADAEAIVPALDEDVPVLEPCPDRPPSATGEIAIDTLTPQAEQFASALDDLDLALAAAGDDDLEAEADGVGAAGDSASLPGITLDNRLARPQPDADVMSRWQEELAQAKSLDEMSDLLAETVFGDANFDRLAADVVSAGAAGGRGGAPPLSRPPDDTNGAGGVELELDTDAGPLADEAVPDERKAQGMTGGFDMSISKRFELLKALGSSVSAVARNDPEVMEITLGSDDARETPASGPAPEPIEAQIDTAITQSRLALGSSAIRKMEQQAAASEDEKQKQSTGLLGLFRRSTK